MKSLHSPSDIVYMAKSQVHRVFCHQLDSKIICFLAVRVLLFNNDFK